jgi:hypothetical protein
MLANSRGLSDGKLLSSDSALLQQQIIDLQQSSQQFSVLSVVNTLGLARLGQQQLFSSLSPLQSVQPDEFLYYDEISQSFQAQATSDQPFSVGPELLDSGVPGLPISGCQLLPLTYIAVFRDDEDSTQVNCSFYTVIDGIAEFQEKPSYSLQFDEEVTAVTADAHTNSLIVVLRDPDTQEQSVNILEIGATEIQNSITVPATDDVISNIYVQSIASFDGILFLLQSSQAVSALNLTDPSATTWTQVLPAALVPSPSYAHYQILVGQIADINSDRSSVGLLVRVSSTSYTVFDVASLLPSSTDRFG